MVFSPLTQAEATPPLPPDVTNPMEQNTTVEPLTQLTPQNTLPSPQTKPTKRQKDFVPEDQATAFIQDFFKTWTTQHALRIKKEPEIYTQWQTLLDSNAPYSQYGDLIGKAQAITWQLRGLVIQDNGIFLNTSFRRKYGRTSQLLRTHLDGPHTPSKPTTSPTDNSLTKSPQATETWPHKRSLETLPIDNSPTGSYLEAAMNMENTARLSNIETKLTKLTTDYEQRLAALTQTTEHQAMIIKALQTELDTSSQQHTTRLDKLSDLYQEQDSRTSTQHDTMRTHIDNIQRRMDELETVPTQQFQQEMAEESLANCLDKIVQQSVTQMERMEEHARSIQEDIDDVTLMAQESINSLTTLCEEAKAMEAAQARTTPHHHARPPYPRQAQPPSQQQYTPFSPQDARAQTSFVTPNRHTPIKAATRTHHHPRIFNPYDRGQRLDEDDHSSDDDQDRHYRPRPSTKSFENQVAYNCRSFGKCNPGKLEALTDKDRPAAAMAYYTQIQSHALQYGIGLLPFADITENTTDLYVPSSQHLTADQIAYERKEYMIALGHKTLEGLTCPNIKNAMLQQMGTHSDGYRILRSIVHSYIPDMKKPHDFVTYAHQTTRPVYDPTKTLFWYQTTLTMYYRREHHYGREYLPGEQTNVFLAGIQNDNRFTQAIETIRHDFPKDYTLPLPNRYKLENIADTVAALASTDPSVGTDVYQSGNPSINMMEADTTHDDDDDPYVAKTNDRTRRPRKRPHVQCQICSGYGHDGKNGRCDRLYALMSYLEWLEAHPTDSKEGLKDYRHRHSPEQRTRLNQAIAHAAKAFGGNINIDRITDDQQQALDAIGDTLAICRVTEADMPQEQDDTDFTDKTTALAIQPQVLQTLHLPPQSNPITYDHEMETDQPSTPSISKMVCTFPSSVTQGDTGANRALTNDRSKLKSFRPIKPFPIGTIGPNNIMATGQGIMTIPTIEGHAEDVQVYYSQAASGSVISPDRHVRESDGRLQRWIQWGDPETGQGAMIFMDSERNHASTIRMYSRNGLWYAQVGQDRTQLCPPTTPCPPERHRHARQVYTTEEETTTAAYSDKTFHDTDHQILQETVSTLRHVTFTDPANNLDSTITTTEASDVLGDKDTIGLSTDTIPYIARIAATDTDQTPALGTPSRLPLKAFTRPVHGSSQIYFESMGIEQKPRHTPRSIPLRDPTPVKPSTPRSQGRRRLYVRGRPHKTAPPTQTICTGAELLLIMTILGSTAPGLFFMAVLHFLNITEIFRPTETICIKQRLPVHTRPSRIVNIGKPTRRRHTFTAQQQIARSTIYQFRLTRAWTTWHNKCCQKTATHRFHEDTAQSGLDCKPGYCHAKTPHIHTVEAPIDTNVPAPKTQLMTEIWHQRMGHIGLDALKQTSQCTTGMTGIGKVHPLFQCQACQMAKMTKAPKPKIENRPATCRGERFHMDFGFVRGPKHLSDLTKRTWTGKRKQTGDADYPDYKPLATSHDGYSSYLLIVDAYTRASFVYLTKSKEPPIETVRLFLTKFGLKQHPNCTIRTDQGGELARSDDFRTMIAKCGYSIEPTGADNSSQNGRGERPHRTLANMVRCLLYSSKLGAEFWSDALVYACYIYNRTHHSVIKKTPFEAWTGTRPDIKHIRTFGTPVTVKRPGNRPSKLHPHVYHGIFLRFTGTKKNIVYYDITTGTVKIATHKQHDEFQYSSDREKRSHASKYIIDLMADEKHNDKYGEPRLDQPLQGLTSIDISPTAAAAATAQVNLNTAEDITDTDGISDSDRWLQYKIGGQQVQLPTSPASLVQMIDDPKQQDHPHIHLAKQIQKDTDILQLELSLDPYAPSINVIVPTDGNDKDLGFRYQTGLRTPTIVNCEKRTPAGSIPRWRSRFRNGTIRSVDQTPVHSIQEFRDIIQQKRASNTPTVTIGVAHEDFAHLHTANGIPQLHFDQLQSLQHHLKTMKYGDDYQLFEEHEETIRVNKAATTTPKLTRRKLQKQADWKIWKEAEWKQLNSYKMQNMFGKPIPKPKGTPTVLPFVWTYILKDGIKPKARGTCNGGKRYGKAVTLAHTYASCVEQPATRLFWALAAANGMTVIGADAGNAFAEAPPPKAPLYMQVDDQFQTWWTEHEQQPPIPPGYVLPVQHAIQGHPESPRLWEQHINQILSEMGFTSTTHERCIYKNKYKGHDILFLRQVDDFAVACQEPRIAREIIATIGAKLTVPLNQLGTISKFNGLDVKQTKHYLKIYCESYINKVLDAHGWQESEQAVNPLPMRDDNAYQATLETAIPPSTPAEIKQLQDAHFNYRQVIGEVIYAMVTCRPDISFAVIKLAQYSANPAECHYKAARQLMKYLAQTKDKGITYWRRQPVNHLPDVPPDKCISRSDVLKNIPHPKKANEAVAYTDSDWAQDRSHRRSVTGLLMMLAGGVIAYKSKYQSTVSLSSTEAEFTAAAEAGKMALYIRSILHELGYSQEQPTILYEDNMGALFMATADQPTKRTKHMDTKTFVIQDWIKEEHLTMEAIQTKYNISDHFTKALGRIKFYEQTDVIMGRRIPSYSPLFYSSLTARVNSLIRDTLIPTSTNYRIQKWTALYT